MGKVMACHNVYDKRDDTPLVDNAVNPPASELVSKLVKEKEKKRQYRKAQPIQHL